MRLLLLYCLSLLAVVSSSESGEDKLSLRVARQRTDTRIRQPVERIVDKKALKEINGDALSKEFIYHPPGHEANVEDYPFFAHWSHAMCGASIVAEDILLTAGHCARKAVDPLKRKQVRMLSTHRETGGFTRHIAHLEIHPKYNQYVQEFDFQLIKVDKSLLVDDNGVATGAKLVRINRNSQNPEPGDPVQAVGFGTVTPDGTSGNSMVLMDATLQAFANDHCHKQYGPGRIVEEIMMCVGSEDGSVDTCQGDSGGPMLDKNNVQLSVVSWGQGCAQADHAGIGSRVSAIADWIDAQICRLSAFPPTSCTPKDTVSYNNRLPMMKEGGDDTQQTHEDTFDLRITVSHDKFPKETAWSLTHKDSFTLLYLQPFSSVFEPYASVSHEFHNLTTGEYLFEIGDSGEDGICCEDGDASTITILNQNTNNVLWEHPGKFEAYLGVTLIIGGDGKVVDKFVSTEFISPGKNATMTNSQNYVNDPQHNDKDWPGKFPETQKSLTVNIKHDNRPYEVQWSLHYLKNISAPAATQRVKDGANVIDDLWHMLPFVNSQDEEASEDESNGSSSSEEEEESTSGTTSSDNQWSSIYSSPPAAKEHSSTLESKTFSNLKPGLYLFTLHDTEGDGICCDYRFGWTTITTDTGKGLDIEGHHHKVLWQHDGEFNYRIQATIKLDEQGTFEVVYSERRK
ncbi:Plasminogen (Fragment) [Seminavis robusta]|uniref:trypsin n=1 Tax=Seminavis robusta TaxID=568900 RepID=A0A9N8DQM8_9STRA